MRHSSLRSAIFGIAAASPAMAHANVGIGFFLPASVLLVVAVIPVIVGLVTATGRSGLYGGVGLLISLALMFGITLWIEILAIRRMQRDDPRPNVRGATLLANLVSYALLGVVAVIFFPEDPNYKRSQMTEVINVLGVAKTEAAEHFRAHGRFAAATRVEPGWRRVRRVSTEETGRIVAQVAFPGSDELDGKTVVYEPEVRGGAIVAWHCYVPEAPFKYFPAACRQRAAGELVPR